jgi:hypothetical protein
MKRPLLNFPATLRALIWPALVWFGVACTDWGVAEAVQPATIVPGKNFSLQPGEIAQTPDGAWRVGFESVTADSRCPKGERCVWAGDATVRIWLQRGAGAKQTHELQAAVRAAQAVRVPDQELRLVRLDPYPVSGKVIAREAYVATLTLIRTTSSEPDR